MFDMLNRVVCNSRILADGLSSKVIEPASTQPHYYGVYVLVCVCVLACINREEFLSICTLFSVCTVQRKPYLQHCSVHGFFANI